MPALHPPYISLVANYCQSFLHLTVYKSHKQGSGHSTIFPSKVLLYDTVKRENIPMIFNYLLTCHEANAYISICSFLMMVNQDTAQRQTLAPESLQAPNQALILLDCSQKQTYSFASNVRKLLLLLLFLPLLCCCLFKCCFADVYYFSLTIVTSTCQK